MPGSNLTRVEAQERKAIITYPIEYTVDLDLTQGPKTFVSTSTIRFGAHAGESTFLDLIADSVESVTVNGETLDVNEVFDDDRIDLNNLKEHNEVVVKAVCRYSTTGEGLHRSVDPSDGNVYLYSQFEVPDARRVYAVFDQPDLKATFKFSVKAPQSWASAVKHAGGIHRGPWPTSPPTARWQASRPRARNCGISPPPPR